MNILSSIMEKIFPAHHAQAQSSASTSVSTPTSAASAPIDVQSLLTQMAQKKSEKLNWQTSIVDLMKLLDMDSSLTARQQLAHELNYSGSLSDTAAMNMWLQKEVMKKFASNGGKVPPELLH